MGAATQSFSVMHHDWHSQSYVEEWIERDRQRDEERRARLRNMFAVAPFAPDAAISVLDVGGGYGVVTEEVLRAFPQARVTLQDYSQPMLDEAQQRLSPFAAQVGYVWCDLRDPSWTEHIGGPFDLAASAIAIHNLGELAAMAGCYRRIDRPGSQTRRALPRLRSARAVWRHRSPRENARGSRLRAGRPDLAAIAGRDPRRLLGCRILNLR